MAESYSDVGVSGGLFLAGKKKLGMIVSTSGNIYTRTWTFTASKTEDSEDIRTYSWYVNGLKQNANGPTFVLRNLKPGNYHITCFALDRTLNYIVGTEIMIPVRQEN